MTGLPCPPWCERDEEEDEGLWLHTRTLIDVAGFVVRLEEGWLWDDGGIRAAPGAPELVVIADGRVVDAPASVELLAALDGVSGSAALLRQR